MLRIYKFNKLFRFFSTNIVPSTFSDTIFALSSGKQFQFENVITNTIICFSGYGKCGVAVIRVSGSYSENALKSIIHLSKTPTPRSAILRSIRNPLNNEILDKGLILWFPGMYYIKSCSFCLE